MVSRLKTHITSNAAKTKYFYYVCPKRTPNRDNGTCPNTKHYRAEALELLVRDILLDALQEETWADFVDKTYNRRMEDLRKMHRFDPSKTRERLLKRIVSLETKMTRLARIIHERLRRLLKVRAMNFVLDVPRPDAAGSW